MRSEEDEFFPQGAPVAVYGGPFIRSRKNASIEFYTPPNSAPANAQLYFEVGILNNMVGEEGGSIELIYKENHGNPNNEGKHNIKVLLAYQSARDGKPASYLEMVELGAEDNHAPIRYQENSKVSSIRTRMYLKKYNAGGDPIRAKGSYQDTPDGGVRYKLEVQDPGSREWKQIFDHVDHGDEQHDINNYRGRSAFRSGLVIRGCTPNLDKGKAELLSVLEGSPVNIVKSGKQLEALGEMGYGNITFKEIGPDDGN